MVQMHATIVQEIKEVLAGDIAAAIGLKDVTTGDTFAADECALFLSGWNSLSRLFLLPLSQDLSLIRKKWVLR